MINVQKVSLGTPNVLKRIFSVSGLAILLVNLPYATAQDKLRKLDRVEKLPTGANTNVLGTFISAGNLPNRTEYIFDAPYEQVWLATKAAAREFDKASGRPVVGIDEQNNRVQNGRIDQTALMGKSGLAPFVDEFVMEVTSLSETQTRVAVARRVMQREKRNLWGPQKSNEKIEKYLLTQIQDGLKNLATQVPSAAASAASEPTRDYAAQAPGTYVRQGKTADYIELNADGTFFAKQDGGGFAGTYKVAGDALTLVLASGIADRAKFRGDTILDSEGITWVRKR